MVGLAQGIASVQSFRERSWRKNQTFLTCQEGKNSPLFSAQWKLEQRPTADDWNSRFRNKLNFHLNYQKNYVVQLERKSERSEHQRRARNISWFSVPPLFLCSLSPNSKLTHSLVSKHEDRTKTKNTNASTMPPKKEGVTKTNMHVVHGCTPLPRS